MTEDQTLNLRITRCWDAAQGMRGFELVNAQRAELPAFGPGAHINLQTPCGIWRKYSLCNDPQERQRYCITVKREASGKGGSSSLVDGAQVGDVLLAHAPENAFAMVAQAKAYLFIAGGIGITPLMAMIKALGSPPRVPWQLVYLTRSADSTAFQDELAAPDWAARVRLHHDHGDPARAFDLWPLLDRPDTAHIYCCGPRALMESVRDMTGHWSPAQVHFESFADGGEARPNDRPFQVRLARSGQRHDVPVGQTILGVLRAAGHTLASSCEAGTCGTCRTGLVEGQADHRDMVLLSEQMHSQILICISRAHSPELVLDL